jgi:transcriptional regulator with XRE-family HTH domain
MQFFEGGQPCPKCGGPGSPVFVDGTRNGKRAGWTQMICHCDDPPLVWEADGKAMRDRRVEAGVSMAVMADALVISPATLSSYESGKQRPETALLQRWEALLALQEATAAAEKEQRDAARQDLHWFAIEQGEWIANRQHEIPDVICRMARAAVFTARHHMGGRVALFLTQLEAGAVSASLATMARLQQEGVGDGG